MRNTVLTTLLLTVLFLNNSEAMVYSVTNLLDNNTTTGVNSGDLRWCVNQVIANAATGPHTINFAVAGGTIPAGSPYPALTNIVGGVTINGFTATGWTSNPIIAIDGPGWGECLTISNSSNSIIQGLVIFDWGSNGTIYINGSNNCQIRGCWIGVNLAQAVAGNNGAAGIYINNANNNNIGGDLSVNPEYKVWITNKQDGIRFESNSQNNTVYGTFIGTNLAGTAGLGTLTNAAVFIRGSSRNIIGATGAGRRNVLSRANFGVRIESAISRLNSIQNNLIGTNLAGSVALGNTTNGVRITDGCHNNSIGGKNSGEGNIISANSQDGIVLEGNVDSTLIGRNYVGLASDGNTVLVNGTGNNHHGILLQGSGCERTKFFYNVIVTPARGSGIYNDGSGYDSICYNYIGTNATGLIAIGIGTDGNQAGIMMNGGGAGPDVRFIGNVVAASTGHGIEVRGGAKNNLVFKGNIVGMNANGLGTTFGNSKTGIYIHPSGSTNLIIGTTNLVDRNIVSYNGRGTAYACSGTEGGGIIIEQMNGASILGNYIGVDATGNVAAGNGNTGISLNGGNNNIVIGSLAAGARNIVCSNGVNCSGPPANVRHGIQFVSNGAATNMQVVGNYVGIGADGNTMLGNAEENISSWQTPNITITNNVVAGGNKGIYLQPASSINCIIRSNYIGTDATGYLARPNNIGIHIQNPPGTIIGGTGAGVGNIISANTTHGILLENADNTVIQQNYIGVGANGGFGLPNGGDGIRIKQDGANGTTGVLIGSPTTTSLGNVIANNVGNGVMVLDANSIQNQIRRNSIYCNGTTRQNGINLNGLGNTNIQISPLISTPPYITAPTPGINGTFTNQAALAGTDVIEVFWDNSCGTCQGRTYLGDATSLNAPAAGDWSFSPLPAAADCTPKGGAGCLTGITNITATRTSSVGNTSEFMDCSPVFLPVELVSFSANPYSVNDVLLKWVTASEKNNNYFELARSRDGISFQPISQLKSALNGDVVNNYSFVDEDLENGLYYYMLIQVDLDGKQTISEIVSVKVGEGSLIKIIPTLLNSGEQLTIINYSGSEVTDISILDLTGKVLIRKSKVKENEFYMSTETLKSGVYMVVTNTDTTHQAQKIIVN